MPTHFSVKILAKMFPLPSNTNFYMTNDRS